MRGEHSYQQEGERGNQNEYNYKKEAEDENHCFKLGHYEERERE